MAFDLSTLPAPVQLAFKMTAPSLWSTVVFGAIACGVKNPNDLADLAFHLHHPELSGRSIKSDEKALIAEWNSYYAHIKKALSGAKAPKPMPSAPPSGGGETVQTYTQEDLVDAAIANLKLTQHLTTGAEANLRTLFKAMLKDLSHNVSIAGRPMPPNQLSEWFKVTKLSYKVLNIGALFASWSIMPSMICLATAMSAVSVVLMVIGFGFALNKAMDAVYRCYGCYGQAYFIVAWAHGGPVPTQSQEVLNNTKHPMYGKAPSRARMDEAWRTGQQVARQGVQLAVAEVAAKNGVSRTDAEQVLKMFMRLQRKTALAKTVMKDIARATRSGDQQVANAVSYQAKSNAWSYPN